MEIRVSHYHLILDQDNSLREALVAFPGRPAVRATINDFPLENLAGFLAAARSLADNAHLRHTDGILYRLTRFSLDTGHVLVAVPTYPPSKWEDLQGSAPIAEVARNIRHRSGLVLFLGAMGDGKTTVATTYLADLLKNGGGTAFAWQDPIETDLEGWHGEGFCHQIEINTDGYAQAGIDALRTRASALFFGEARTPQAFLAVLNTAMTGTQTITTSHGDNLIDGILNFVTKAHTLDNQAYHLLAARLTAAFHLRLKDTGNGPVLSVDYLLVPEGPNAIRSQIRGQNIEALATPIRVQSHQPTPSPRPTSGAFGR